MPTMMVILLLTVDKIIEKRIADIMRSFGKEGEDQEYPQVHAQEEG